VLAGTDMGGRWQGRAMASLFGLRAIRIQVLAAGFAAAGVMSGLIAPALAADPILKSGLPIVTGFSGVVSPTSPPAGTDPLDRTFIDPDGNSVVVETLAPDAAPHGELIDSTPAFAATAKDVGQVFGVALDNAPEITGAAAPDIYVAATSAYGLNLVVTGPDGNPVRSKTGAPGATFMPGQWGSAGGATGYPGSIWKIDGTTGAISLFTTIAANTGAGLGDIVFDAASQQFFVSDLDSGLIYRLASDGTIIDSFDHGVTGRPTHGLSAVADDGSAVDVTNPAFNTEDPSTWGFTQPERKVDGLAVHGGRLYYAVADGPAVWSVGINPDGSFGTPRWEFDVTGLPSTNEITHIVFDSSGRMILAQRGAQAGSYDYSSFAAQGTSSVVRYTHEFPDDPSTPSTWVETPDSYAIGFKPDGSNATGGIALGNAYDSASNSFDGACNATLWASGDSLRDNPAATPPLGPPAQVSGLQGVAVGAVRPADDPPTQAFFTDFDGNTDAAEAAKQGHVGGVAIWQDCSGTSAAAAPIVVPPPPPPHPAAPTDFDLSLFKWSNPHACIDGGANWWCNFTIRVENTGTTPYWGPISVNDTLPAHNAGAVMHFWPQPPWACSPAGPYSAECTTGPGLLFPGDAVDLHEVVQLPKALVNYCNLPNVASLDWNWWGHDSDPSDDFGFAGASIAAGPCASPPPPGSSNLALTKSPILPICLDGGADWLCTYGVNVQNTGPGHFSGPVKVVDTLGVNAPMSVIGPWSCGQVGPVLTCNLATPPVNAPPGWSSGFLVTAHVKKNSGTPLCTLPNKANIQAPVGAPLNVFSGDDFGNATVSIPDPACFAPQPHTDIKITKSASGSCVASVYMGTNGYTCDWIVTITNIGPNTYTGPISFKDATGSASHSSLQSSPICSGPPQVQTCSVPSVTLLSGAPHPISVSTFYPGGPSVCSVSNNASILSPNPGSPQNPAGNDSASASQTVPNPLCNPLAAKLNVTKTATGCASDPSSSDWLCDFTIKVTNLGAGPQPAPIVVNDNNNRPTTFSGPAACVPAGPNNYTCTRSTPLNGGASWTFQATSHVNPNGVTLADCDVVDTVHITTPSAPGNPGYAAQASEKVPQLFINVGPGPVAVYCDPPSLKLAKIAGPCLPTSGGYDCSFTVVATSTGPDPYHGTVELDEQLPTGTTFKASDWTCVPTTGNDVHCSLPYHDIAVGNSVSMHISIFVPAATAVRSDCQVTNTVNASISAAVLHSSKGAQYTASANAKLPPEACASPPPTCPPSQLKPGGGCCDQGLAWNGRTCAPPVVGKPCPPDSSRNDAGACACDPGTHGDPGHCRPDQQACPPDSSPNSNGACACDPGTHGDPGHCRPDQQACPPGSVPSDNGNCVCPPNTHGRPGRCVPDNPLPPPPPNCAPDSTVVNGACVCKPGTHGDPGRCITDQATCPPGSVPSDTGNCVCPPNTHGRPGRCVPDNPLPPPSPPSSSSDCAKDSHVVDGKCICLPGTHGDPGKCVPDTAGPPVCPKDSIYDRRTKACVCKPPLAGKPGECTAQLTLQLPKLN